jgi:hypothetical protein
MNPEHPLQPEANANAESDPDNLQARFGCRPPRRGGPTSPLIEEHDPTHAEP